MDIFKEAGLPDGVINLVTGDPEMISDIALAHSEFSGLHFTGSTSVFRDLLEEKLVTILIFTETIQEL